MIGAERQAVLGLSSAVHVEGDEVRGVHEREAIVQAHAEAAGPRRCSRRPSRMTGGTHPLRACSKEFVSSTHC